MSVAVLVALLATTPQAAAQTAEFVAEVRVHGNHTTAEADVLALVDVQVGEAATDDRLRAIERALVDSGRFAGVEVRKRFRSLDDPHAIVLVIVVNERPGVSEDLPVPGPLRKLAGASMWLPVLRYEDGYGFTYGARLTVVDAFGDDSRLSVPLTWGGERRAAVEIERYFAGRSLTRLTGLAGMTRRANPHFEVADTRQTVAARAERAFTPWLRAGAGAGLESVSFGASDERQWTGGADLTLDTRLDPAFPRNAVYGRVSWQRLNVSGARIGRWSTAFEGYLGLAAASVLAIRAQTAAASETLPAWEHALLGGAGTLRGYQPGHRAGDNLAAVSAELRVPLTSPLKIGRVGVRTFVDSGAIWDVGERWSQSRWDRGIGAGIFLNAPVVSASVDVAWPEAGGARWHIGLGARF
ncbi:MAG: BamA/TamA family outer membrane protein [Acidobacteria bacterium]|nr:BamA/TamA family outer membrane protein [Acidobacteriota bacterium]